MVTLFSAKASPGVTSTSLALAAVWPRPVVLVEADPASTDLAYRCRTADAGVPATSPTLLSLGTAAARPEQQGTITDWTQRLACGVDVVLGVTSPSQARGIEPLWTQVTEVLRAAETDVLVDVGRATKNAAIAALVEAADVRIPVAKAAVESVIATRELLKDLPFSGGVTMPVMVGSARSGAADCRDLDDVLSRAGVIAEESMSVALDHPGLLALEAGVSPRGRGRGSLLIRSARGIAEKVGELV